MTAVSSGWAGLYYRGPGHCWSGGAVLRTRAEARESVEGRRHVATGQYKPVRHVETCMAPMREPEAPLTPEAQKPHRRRLDMPLNASGCSTTQQASGTRQIVETLSANCYEPLATKTPSRWSREGLYKSQAPSHAVWRPTTSHLANRTPAIVATLEILMACSGRTWPSGAPKT